MSNPIPQIVAGLDDIIGRHRGSEWAMIDTCYLMTLRDALSDLVHIPTDIDDLTKMGLNPNTKYGQIYIFLSRHPERIVPAEDLMKIAEVTSKAALWVYIYRIRERLAEHTPGVSLESYPHVGYRLTRCQREEAIP